MPYQITNIPLLRLKAKKLIDISNKANKDISKEYMFFYLIEKL